MLISYYGTKNMIFALKKNNIPFNSIIDILETVNCNFLIFKISRLYLENILALYLKNCVELKVLHCLFILNIQFA